MWWGDNDVDAQKAASEALNKACSSASSKQDCLEGIDSLGNNTPNPISPPMIKSIHKPELECNVESSSELTSCDAAAFNILNDPNHSSGKGVLTLDQDTNMALWSSEGSSNANYTYTLNMTANHSNNDQGAITYSADLSRMKLSDETG